MGAVTRVLVTDHGDPLSRSALAAVRALGAAGYRPVVTLTGRWSLASLSRDCTRTVRVPVGGGGAYASAVRDELGGGAYLTALVASDEALLALEAPVGHLLDKTALLDRAREADLPVPPSEVYGSFEDLLRAADDLDYPVVVKPSVKRFWTFRADGPEDLARRAGDFGRIIVQPFLDEPLHAVAGVAWEGSLAASVHQRYERIWPPHCGTSSAAVTVGPDPALEERLLRLLGDYSGVFQAQFAGPYLMDLNPRVYGSLPLAVAAGANLPAIHCDLLQGREPAPVRARPGVFYRWIEGDVRSLVRAVRDGSMRARAAVAALRPRRGAAHSTESFRDPIPMLGRLWSAVGGLVARRPGGIGPQVSMLE